MMRMLQPKTPSQRISEKNQQNHMAILARQRSLIATWDLYLSYSETQDREGDEGAGIIGPGVPEWHLRCMECGQSVTRVYTGGNPIAITINRIQDDYVRHARQVHERMLPDGSDPDPEDSGEPYPGSGCHCDPATDGGNTCTHR